MTQFKQYRDVINGGTGLVRAADIALSENEVLRFIDILESRIGERDFNENSRQNLLAQLNRALVELEAPNPNHD